MEIWEAQFIWTNAAGKYIETLFAAHAADPVTVESLKAAASKREPK